MVKRPTTYSQQLEILKSRNVLIEDEAFCLEKLEQLNYYRLTAYLLPYKTSDGTYKNISFNKAYNIYEFDRKLRSLLLATLEEIELGLRTKLAYYHAHKFGALGYLQVENYNNKHCHESFVGALQELIRKNKDNPFVAHHIKNKNGEFPIWVAVELFSFGMLSKFFADMNAHDKKYFSRQYGAGYEQLESWFLCLTNLRNRCAHYMRLYFYNFNKWPKLAKGERLASSNKIFNYIKVMKYCYVDKIKWNRSFLTELKALMEQYAEDIEREHLGFPDDWERLLQ